MTECILVDIDGTVADCAHRRKFVEVSPKDWDSFLEPKQVMKDKVILPIADLLRHLVCRYQIIYVSGRKSSLYDTTKRWLRKHGLWFYPHRLFMRTDGDYREDSLVKEELLEEILALGYVPKYVLDDRNSVVEMWRRNGLTCLQVADGDF